MSADNWVVCPRCEKKKKLRLSEAYGKVTPEEYEKLLHSREGEDENLREDWEIGIWDGKFLVNFSSRCEDCKFEFNYKHEEVVI
jgi:hypothetical protein